MSDLEAEFDITRSDLLAEFDITRSDLLAEFDLTRSDLEAEVNTNWSNQIHLLQETGFALLLETDKFILLENAT